MTTMSRSSSSSSSIMTPTKVLSIVGMMLFVAQQQQQQQQYQVMAIKEVRFASPLQSLTIPDPELFSNNDASSDNKDTDTDGEKNASSRILLDTPRKRFLPRFLIGLKAENKLREKIAIGQVKISDAMNDDDFTGSDWVGKIKSAEERREYQENKLVQAAHDSAVELHDNKQEEQKTTTLKKENSNKYQIVGVINSSSSSSSRNKSSKKRFFSKNKGITNTGPISWYARPKPKNAKWSIRMIHVNKDAIIKDLFDRGKIDIFAKYTNTGRTSSTTDVDKQRQIETKEREEQQKDGTVTKTKVDGLVPIVTTKYEARERSWKTLWNFSPKHFFTDPSGSYWRERRLHSSASLLDITGSRSSSGGQLYTDGDNVYESTYRYRDGRNGMHFVSTLQQFLVSSNTGVTNKQKQIILKKLQSKSPDIVVEEL